MKKITKHMYSSGGFYIGSEEVPIWHQWMSIPVAMVICFSILLGVGVVAALNGKDMFHSKSRPSPPISLINDLPF